MKAIISVTGKDNKGIIAAVSALCAESEVNILDISQTVLSEYFAMIMLVDIDNLNSEFGKFAEKLEKLGDKKALKIHAMHEAIFNSMHKI